MNTKKKFLSFALACLMLALTFSAAIPVFAQTQAELDAEKAKEGYVCRIGETYYKYFSLCDQKAIDDGVSYTETAIGQHNADTITLIADITTGRGGTNQSAESVARPSSGVIQSHKSAINVDGNGHTYTCKAGFKVTKYPITISNLNMVLIGDECFGYVQRTTGGSNNFTLTFTDCNFTIGKTACRSDGGYFLATGTINNLSTCNLVIQGSNDKKSTVTIENTDATIPLIAVPSNSSPINITLDNVYFDVSTASNMKVIDIGKGGNISVSNSTLKSKNVSALSIGAVDGTATTSTVNVNNSTVASEADSIVSFSGNQHTVRLLGNTNLGLTAPTLVAGASVRTTAGSNGLRFKASMPASIIANGGVTEYGMLFARTASVSGEFVETALAEGTYIMSAADKTKTVDGVFTFALTDIAEDNYNTMYSARAYVKYSRGDATVIVYSTYTVADNSRSLAGVAKMATEDFKTTYDAENGYICKIEDGKYSPYDKDQLAVLATYADKYAAE